ncbi:MAG: Methyl-viologen-reducing hydrogenase delta subunit [Thermodesulfobacterium sp. 37_54]|uniref:F420-non-reducing hydrogenase iron-sulfur subunit D domain-containing protein n=1 Tax=Thermodesulfobacterium commune TaxID=1741 RepID=A0A101FJ77_9BACT|nr:MAG: Methyl-viologen-reducing hydrogenase delta subunit [Thermodesulfobacterium sp. 37_54]KUK38044.1 MAG: Methyl-viologen-reducing hydrogenase delta subunit [Thermodesulfobacterium commune]HAA83471.1 hypothetical protein [Thermodesulfobacterium commune]HBT04305.1 hypothetical protein [Thermodesulfobacterium commune]HCE79451.1 hypothetical protein [Thermodesulfobacterium commune]
MKGKTLMFVCRELGSEEEMKDREDIVLKTLDCAGDLTVFEVLKALEEGFQQVFVVGCKKGTCKSRIGNLRAEKRMATVRRYLGKWAEGYRLEMVYLNKEKGQTLLDQILKA